MSETVHITWGISRTPEYAAIACCVCAFSQVYRTWEEAELRMEQHELDHMNQVANDLKKQTDA